MRNIKKIFIGTMAIVAIMVTAPTAVFAKDGPGSFADLAQKLLPAVVNVSTTQTIKINRRPPPQFPGMEEFFKRFGQGPNSGQTPPNGKPEKPITQHRRSLGSGFIIDSSGIIITNNHVIEKADSIMVKMHDGREFKAKLIGTDRKLDIAVLKITSKKPLPSVRFGDDTKSRVGDWVLAIGNPYGLGGTITAGIISARNRDINSGPYDKYIQTDASINRGNSGGPMFNMKGEVIGINTAIYSPTGGNIGIGFAIPSDQAQHVIAQLRKYGHTKRGRIGISFQPMTEDIAESLGMENGHGALVSSVVKGGPADKAGIQTGDIILEYQGKTIMKRNELPIWVANTKIGNKVSLLILRKGKKKTVTLKVDELKEDNTSIPNVPNDADNAQESKQILGMNIEPLTPKIRKALKLDTKVAGVLIASVDRDSPAGERGLHRGDVITSITQQPVKTVDQVLKRIKILRKKGRKSILLKIIRQGNTAFITIKFKAK